MTDTRIEALYTYPIKSCAPVALDHSPVTAQGLAYDREWMVTRPNGTFLSQRHLPELSLVKTAIDDEYLYVHAPSNGSIRLPLERDDIAERSAIDITIFEKRGTAVSQGEEADDFFSDYLGRPARLLRAVKPRPIKPAYRVVGASKTMQFADGFPLLMASAASLDLLNEFSDTPLAMNRFRPNVVVDGPTLEPYDEDYWRTIALGDLRAFVVRACARCPMPDVDQARGRQTSGRPATNALRETRGGTEPTNDAPKLFFGQNLVHVATPDARLTVGDPVTILERSSHRNIRLDAETTIPQFV